ncbi:MAG: hypothetical protein EXS36_06300 [Pedosphaera sp.]|nr:hypothetical protein [Pedosphaera sp.]
MPRVSLFEQNALNSSFCTSIKNSRYTLLAARFLAAVSLQAGTPKEDVSAAVKKLADQPSYSWSTATEIEGSQFKPGATTGKTEKGGFTVISQEVQDNTVMAVRKGDKAVVKTPDGWKTADELPQPGGGGGGQDPAVRAAMMGRRLLTAKTPADEAGGLANKIKELKSADGVISGELTEEGAKELATLGRRGGGGGGGGGNAPKDAKGSVKYWLKDGMLSKVELKVSGKVTGRDGEERSMSRTTVTEIQNVGSTKVEVAEEAKKKTRNAVIFSGFDVMSGSGSQFGKGRALYFLNLT